MGIETISSSENKTLLELLSVSCQVRPIFVFVFFDFLGVGWGRGAGGGRYAGQNYTCSSLAFFH